MWLNARMNRRVFLSRMGALAVGLPLAGCAAGGGAVAVPRPDSGATPQPEPTPPQTSTISGVALLAAAGDTTLGYNLEAHVDEKLALGISKESLFPLYMANVRPILEWADVAMLNLECPFTERGEPLLKNFNFRARPELVEILKAGTVDAVTLANNHLKDYGDEGVLDTVTTLDQARIGHFGAGTNLAEARRPLILERQGVRLGFLGYYFQADPDMIEPEAVYATAESPGVAGCYKDLECMERMVSEDVASLVPQVDAVIPYFHWGKEGSSWVRDYQVRLAHRCIDLGCRAVLGAHPHRLQGVEVYRGAPVFYSLGNFVFGGNKDPKDKLSAIARLRVPRTGPVEADLVPVQITRWPEAAFQPFVLEGPDKEAALARIATLSRGFAVTLPQLAQAMPPLDLAAPVDPGPWPAVPDSALTPH
jgi:poly-gamma-glutamate synthesis protein (capsule biosynthesis protein)